ncbi:sugar isomerase [Vallitalea longa]|uniref:Sugar isomerase n=1 Tax=Vallitalea longa TaxID=2936439 RepID=A0A9W5YFF1_9FIRM|nr:SIS domain-containing protein [Vallitalea longa]GKX31520.1 sugar isomerase [Vallitalea longa]
MFNFNEKEFLQTEQSGLDIIKDVETTVDKICNEGYSNIFFVGIGGTIAYAKQTESIVKSHSTLNLHVENAANLVALGNFHLNKNSIVVIESKSGDTKEIVEAVDYVHKIGAKVLGYIGNENSILSEKVDYVINGNSGPYYFWFSTSLRFMYNNGEYTEYADFIENIQNLPAILCQVQKDADKKCEIYAEKYKDAPIQYFIGSGNLEGWAYCYAMCILEEMQWMRTKFVSGSNFFHGTLEVIDRDTSVILFKGEDNSRVIMDRVDDFVQKISANVTVFDTKDYSFDNIDEKYRELISPFIMRAICQRISVHLEHKRRHPLAIRRYYRCLDY